MPFIKRGDDGKICGVSLSDQAGYSECPKDERPELEQFLRQFETVEASFSETDLDLVRVLEDLIDLLVEREVIRVTDLPQAAQNKLLTRRNLRATLKPALDLLEKEANPII